MQDGTLNVGWFHAIRNGYIASKPIKCVIGSNFRISTTTHRGIIKTISTIYYLLSVIARFSKSDSDKSIRVRWQ